MGITRLKAGTFMGQVQKRRTLNGFTLSRSDHRHHAKVPNHEHEFPYLSLLLHGAYKEHSVVSDDEVKVGSLLYRPKGFEHKNEIGSRTSLCFNIEIEKPLTDLHHYSQEPDFIQFERNNLEIFKIYYGFQSNFSEELLTLSVEENLHLLFQQKSHRITRDRESWVDQIKQEVRFHPERTYSLNSIADSFCLHPNYFVRKFKSVTGYTFGEYLLRQRLERGIDLILHSSKSLTEIALECGFYDQSHFIRRFKQSLGATPSQYRKVLKG